MKSPYFLLVLLFFFSSCKKDNELSREDIIITAIEHLTLTCDKTISSEYYLKGKLRNTEFCHFPGHQGYYAYTANGNTFVTYTPHASTTDTAGFSNYSRYFFFSFLTNPETDFPEEFVAVKIKLPNEGDFADEFFDLMTKDQLPFTNWEEEKPGVVIELNLWIKGDLTSEGYTGARFTTAEGDQSDSHFQIKSFTVDRAEDHYYGEAAFEFKVNLYHNSSHVFTGYWETMEGEMVIPYTLYL